LDSRRYYDICGLCDWNDGGVKEDDQYTGQNQMALDYAKEIFSKNMRNLPLDKWVKD
jgi:hypothetical protein